MLRPDRQRCAVISSAALFLYWSAMSGSARRAWPAPLVLRSGLTSPCAHAPRRPYRIQLASDSRPRTFQFSCQQHSRGEIYKPLSASVNNANGLRCKQIELHTAFGMTGLIEVASIAFFSSCRQIDPNCEGFAANRSFPKVDSIPPNCVGPNLRTC